MGQLVVGPRHLIAIVPVLLAPCALWLEAAVWRTRAFVALCALGLVIAVAGVLVPTQAQQLDAPPPNSPTIWRQYELLPSTVRYSVNHTGGGDRGRPPALPGPVAGRSRTRARTVRRHRGRPHHRPPGGPGGVVRAGASQVTPFGRAPIARSSQSRADGLRSVGRAPAIWYLRPVDGPPDCHCPVALFDVRCGPASGWSHRSCGMPACARGAAQVDGHGDADRHGSGAAPDLDDPRLTAALEQGRRLLGGGRRALAGVARCARRLGAAPRGRSYDAGRRVRLRLRDVRRRSRIPAFATPTAGSCAATGGSRTRARPPTTAFVTCVAASGRRSE